MLRKITLVIIILSLSVLSFSRRSKPPSKKELFQITKRGILLAEYDQATHFATNALLRTKPDASKVSQYVAQGTKKGWIVAFGQMSKDNKQFMIYYLAVQKARADQFRILKFKSPKKNKGYYLRAARALGVSHKDFLKNNRPTRPYNNMVIPAGNGKMWVYLVPAPMKSGIQPLGGDTRYLVSRSGYKILKRRKLHRGIIEKDHAKKEVGFHVVLLDDIPEDTDVFYVLTREPRIPEIVLAVRKDWVYQIDKNGAIKYLGTKDKVFNDR